MKLVLIYSKNVKILVDICCHLELEKEPIDVHRSTDLVANAGKCKAFRPKRKQQRRSTRALNSLRSKDKKVAKRQRGKHAGKDKSKLRRYKCRKVRHFAYECTDIKKVSIKHNFLITYICLHVTQDRVGFI